MGEGNQREYLGLPNFHSCDQNWETRKPIGLYAPEKRPPRVQPRPLDTAELIRGSGIGFV